MESSSSSLLTIRDIIDFAVMTENKTEDLYDGLSKLMKSAETRDLFITFAGEESKHSSIFKNMLLDFGKNIYESEPVPEHIHFLNIYINGLMFNKDILSKKISRIIDIESVFEFLTGIELDTILFYNEITGFMAEDHKILIKNIIEEERRHFVRIMQIKQMKDY